MEFAILKIKAWFRRLIRERRNQKQEFLGTGHKRSFVKSLRKSMDRSGWRPHGAEHEEGGEI